MKKRKKKGMKFAILKGNLLKQSNRYFSSSRMLNDTKLKYLKQKEAQQIDQILMGKEYAFTIDQLMELAGFSVATCVYKEAKILNGKAFESNKPSVIVVSGSYVLILSLFSVIAFSFLK